MTQGGTRASHTLRGLTFWLAFAVLGLPACRSEPTPLPLDAELTRSIAWYTGVAGTVDDAKARSLLEASLEDPDPLSTMWLARVHSRGRMGYPRDSLKAVELAAGVIEDIQGAADVGMTEAVFLMGTAWDEGLGRAEDPTTAASWYRRAAEEGHVLGQHNLGNLYAAGRGVPQNDSLAALWWEKAANKGDAITQLRLGEAYEAGRGVSQDRDLALHWYRLAAGAGNPSAVKALSRLTSEP